MIRDLLAALRAFMLGDAQITTREYTLNIQRLQRKLKRLQDRRHMLFTQAQYVERQIADMARERIAARRRRDEQQIDV